MSRKSIKFSTKSSRQSSLSMGGNFSASAHIVGMNVPFKLAQGTSGVGCITSNNTGPSLSNVTDVVIDPYTLGSRCALLAAEFAQWKVSRMTIQYVSDMTSSGVVNTQGGPSTTPSYGSRPFALGWHRDPSVLVTTHPTIMETGGISNNTSRNSKVINLPPSAWLYTSTTTSYAGSAIDNRMTAHGSLSGAFVDASTTAAATYGRIVICYDLSFRYPQNASVIGESISSLLPSLSSSTIINCEQKEEQKSEILAPQLGWKLVPSFGGKR